MRKLFIIGAFFFKCVIIVIQGQDTCSRSPLKAETQADGTITEFCQYKGGGNSAPVEVYPGSEFVTEDCKVCKCTAAGLACCQSEGPPTNIPNGCEVVPDGCQYNVVKTSNKNIDCYTGNVIERRSGKNDKQISVTKILNSPETFALINLFKNMYSKLQEPVTPKPKPAQSPTSFYNPYYPFGQQIQQPIKQQTNKKKNKKVVAVDREPTLNDFLNWYNTKFQQGSQFGPMFGGMGHQMYPMAPMMPMSPMQPMMPPVAPSMKSMMPNTAMNGMVPGVATGAMWNPVMNSQNPMMNNINSANSANPPATASDIPNSIAKLLSSIDKNTNAAAKNKVSGKNTTENDPSNLISIISKLKSLKNMASTKSVVSNPLSSASALDLLRTLRDQNTQVTGSIVPGMSSLMSMNHGSVSMPGGLGSGMMSMLGGAEANPMMMMMGGMGMGMGVGTNPMMNSAMMDGLDLGF